MMINKVKKSLPYVLLGVVIALGALMLPPAIKFFFRGFLLLLENPLEAFCFFGILSAIVSFWIYMEENE